MPVVELSYMRLQKLVGKVTKKQISDSLPFLGLDIESENKDLIRIEYSPNRPDYSTDFGIALGLQGLLRIKTGSIKLNIKKSKKYAISVKSEVSKVRPFVTGIVAKNGKIDDKTIKQFMTLQEDLHFGIGRKRKKLSIGIHDLDKITFPLVYKTTNRNFKFIPLNSKKELSISEILKNTDVGKDYSSILENSSQVPLILDAKQNTVSFPPIINAALTSVTTKTKNLFVEVTGINKEDAEDMLSVVATILQSAGFTLESVQISGAKNSSPKLEQKKMSVSPFLINQTLGLNLNNSKIISSLKKSRLDASTKGKNIICTIPAYRFDIFGPMDLVEEVALGYGIQNLEPTLSPSQTLGQKHPSSISLQSLSSIMTGLGYMEALNSSLTSKRILYDNTKRDSSKILSVLDSKSLEHTILRDSLLPGLIDNLAKNIHESYPQKLFEIGTIFNKTSSVTEETHLCAVSSHKDANFSEIKSVLQSVIQSIFGKTCETKTSTHPTFEKGHVANITVNGKIIGIIGEISKPTKDNFKLRESIVSFEVKLPS
ncbi:phenylalanine--tRNA ligase subunit beta [Marine Group I thaumarchaeote]|uniref:phenylalanine--tRNA ligase n=1 Tax=Marine Group I thaumarchaeote TaxID=2511932 RepID=A0A7K4N8B8_9ARCH|nr:MAG: phenylalanine--tRNA ligase subunit beta [Nitrosopumilus sp. YT1]NMI82210.1 phenylalanine--tRNA ligase subunit beta [Candidatus Nitrosopumilus sp. MTA1]NWJ20432.1 phenylalanine--tRNA ligase subunit beta [Marine Group I thaumarchaeote]NWJ28296.1 phenylalanine--tRNA ligase subunit beta [Marine Group I thaumarchaeote]NWJ56240.1 phenylalanine--tRNA ligase subunit beta [Marine Group I thaumarchaeote]